VKHGKPDKEGIEDEHWKLYEAKRHSSYNDCFCLNLSNDEKKKKDKNVDYTKSNLMNYMVE